MDSKFYDKRPINNLHEAKHSEFIISLIIKAPCKNTPSSFVKEILIYPKYTTLTFFTKELGVFLQRALIINEIMNSECFLS